ncbi:hypothetical protein RHOER0001_3991 [Rhodococcus erythropolis SK121]|nr:hypothetical protein RHOER0001_3991 [Rhodococcus erythropolis SK121]
MRRLRVEYPRQQENDQRRPGDALRFALIGPPTGTDRAQCSDQSCDSEEPDLCGRQPPWFLTQRQGHSAPQSTKGREKEQGDQGPGAKQSVRKRQRHDRPHCTHVRTPIGLRTKIFRQHRQRDGRDQYRNESGSRVDRPPACQIRNCAGDSPSEDDADDNAAGDDTDACAPLVRVTDCRSIGNYDLNNYREHACDRHPDQQLQIRGGQSNKHRSRCSSDDLDCDQFLSIHEIAQWHQHDQPHHITELGECDYETEAGRRNGKIRADLPEERLCVVDIGYRDTAEHREQQAKSTRHFELVPCVLDRLTCSHFHLNLVAF